MMTEGENWGQSSINTSRNKHTSFSAHWTNTAGNQSLGSQGNVVFGTIQVIYCCKTNYPHILWLPTIKIYYLLQLLWVRISEAANLDVIMR